MHNSGCVKDIISNNKRQHPKKPFKKWGVFCHSVTNHNIIAYEK